MPADIANDYAHSAIWHQSNIIEIAAYFFTGLKIGKQFVIIKLGVLAWKKVQLYLFSYI